VISLKGTWRDYGIRLRIFQKRDLQNDMEEIEKLKKSIQDGEYAKYVILNSGDCEELFDHPDFGNNSFKLEDRESPYIYGSDEYMVSVDWINSL